MRFFLVKQQSEKGRVESPSRLAPSTPQSQSFVNQKGGLLLSPALERPDKESFFWEMCYMEVFFMIVDVLTHALDPLMVVRLASLLAFPRPKTD